MANIVVRELGNAIRLLQQSLYKPPQTVIDGINENLWPNPLQPVAPIGPPGAEPLGFNFNYGQNLIYTPRSDSEYSAEDLRRLATYPLARVCIENNKDILCRMPRKIQLKPLPGETSKDRAARGKGDGILKKLNRFFDRPNWNNDWAEFLRPVLDDMLVIDAASIFIARNKSGDVDSLRWVEGASITRLVDAHGWTPPPPSVAYQQLWEGYPRLDLTTDQLVYRPRNIVPRGFKSSYIYGMSPVEQIAKEIEIGWQRLQYIYDFYAEGSIPGGMVFAPVDTPVEKIKEAQQFIDSDLAGQLAKRRRLQIMQGFQKDGKTEQLHFPKEPVLADVFDDVHTRKVCFAFGTSPTRLMRQMNRSSGQQMQDSAEEEGTLPFLNWLKGTMDYIIQVVMKLPEYEFAFDPFMELDKLKQSMADNEDIKGGLYTRNEKREDRGDDPRPEPEADQLMITTGTGLVPLDYIPPKPVSGSAPGGRAPKGGAQPKATAQVNATSGSRPAKSNGHSTWETCEKHKDSYPRSFCSDCIKSELNYREQMRQEINDEVTI